MYIVVNISVTDVVSYLSYKLMRDWGANISLRQRILMYGWVCMLSSMWWKDILFPSASCIVNL